MAWSADVNLENKGKVGGTATISAGDSELNGSIGGDVLAFLGAMDINGSMGGNVRVRSGHSFGRIGYIFLDWVRA